MVIDQQTLVILMVIGAVMLVAIVLLLGDDPKDRASNRAASLGKSNQGGKKGKGGAQDRERERRRQVTESLKSIEERQKEFKAKGKLTLPNLIIQAGFEFTIQKFYIMSAIAGVVLLLVGFLTGQALWVSLAMGIVGFFGLPRWFLNRARKKRQKKFSNEFANAVDVIVRGVKSGLPVNECLKIIAAEAQSPIREEFQLLTEGIRVGLSLEQSLDRMYQRMPINEVNFFATVLTIQKQTGGNLASALGNLSAVLRGRKTMLGKIAALSMEAKASAAILAAMPFIVSGLVYMSNPQYLMPLFETSTGQFLLMGSGVWMLIGVLVMKNMISIKV